MPPRRKLIPDRTVRIKIRTRIMPNPDASVHPDDVLEPLKQLLAADYDELVELLLLSIQATMLKAIERRFENSLGSMTKLIGARGGRGDNAAQTHIRHLQQTLIAAERDGSQSDIRDAHEALNRALDKYAGAHSTEKKKLINDYGGRVGEVLNKLIGAKKKQAFTRTSDLTLRFGNIAFLDQTLTAGDRPTDSKYNILWRQLEFGTGIFAKPKPRVSGPANELQHKVRDKSGNILDGSWWLNDARILGSQPGNFLRRATGVAYDEDFTLFQGHFQKALNRKLRGLS